MLIGEYNHSIDDKGRVAVPAKFRAFLKKGGVITHGLDGCLFLYSSDAWGKWTEKVRELSVASRNARAFTRIMLGRAMEVTLDAQGRINVPGYLRETAKLKGNAVIVGLQDRIEIWSEEAWNKYREQMSKEADEIAEQLQGLGL